MDADAVRRLLESSGALQRGHFLLSSGLHSAGYVQCARALEDPARARHLGAALAARLEGDAVDSVLSPALGGLVIGHETAAALGVPFRFVERVGEGMELRRGFRLAEGERVAVVEDVVTTGRSTAEAIAVAGAAGAEVVAVGAIVDRTGGRSPFAVPLVALTAVELPVWEGAECPLCAEGSRAVKPGSRP